MPSASRQRIVGRRRHRCSRRLSRRTDRDDRKQQEQQDGRGPGVRYSTAHAGAGGVLGMSGDYRVRSVAARRGARATGAVGRRRRDLLRRQHRVPQRILRRRDDLRHGRARRSANRARQRRAARRRRVRQPALRERLRLRSGAAGAGAVRAGQALDVHLRHARHATRRHAPRSRSRRSAWIAPADSAREARLRSPLRGRAAVALSTAPVSSTTCGCTGSVSTLPSTASGSTAALACTGVSPRARAAAAGAHRSRGWPVV